MPTAKEPQGFNLTEEQLAEGLSRTEISTTGGWDNTTLVGLQTYTNEKLDEHLWLTGRDLTELARLARIGWTLEENQRQNQEAQRRGRTQATRPTFSL